MNLSGDRCRCSTCREYFNSTRAFDMHRVGSFVTHSRRCLAPSEMEAKGMARNSKGFWLTKKFTDQPARGGESRAISPDPSSGSHPAHPPAERGSGVPDAIMASAAQHTEPTGYLAI